MQHQTDAVSGFGKTQYAPGIDFNVPIDTTPLPVKMETVFSAFSKEYALDFLGHKISYGRLGKQVETFCAALQAMGVDKGTRVGLLMPNMPMGVVAFFAVLKAGGVLVNLNPLYTAEKLTDLLNRAQCDLVVTTDLVAVFENVPQIAHKRPTTKFIVCPFAGGLSFPKSLLFKLVKGKDIAQWRKDPMANRACVSLSDVLAKAGALTSVTLGSNDLAVIQFTGGTTGEMKSAPLSHGNIAANVSQITHYSAGVFSPGAQVVAVLPFFHVFAMTVCMCLPLSTGCTVVILPRYEPKMAFAMLKRVKPNILIAVPTLLNALTKHKNDSALKSIDVVISGGGPLPLEIRHNFARASEAIIAEGYGLTEASPVVCCSPVLGEIKDNCIGFPIPGTYVEFRSLDDPKIAVARGEFGELCVKGPQVMKGYMGVKDPSNDFVDGFLRTGDVGYVDEDGQIFIVDRIKELIISSGFNIYPRQIEDALDAHEAVDECCVIAVPDPHKTEVPVAYVTLVKGAQINEANLAHYLTTKLSKLECPREIILRDELPKTLIGKLSKKDLVEIYKQDHPEKFA